MNSAFKVLFPILAFIAVPSAKAATFTVTSNVDGAGSLFEAITNANNTPGVDIIDFTGMGATSIVIGANLPAITDQVTIDGTTANGYDPNNPPITVFGNNGTGFDLNNAGAAGSQILGLRLTNHNIAINIGAGADDVLVDECYFDQITNVSVDVNGADGVTITNGTFLSAIHAIRGTNAVDFTIGGIGQGNLISGTSNTGIQILDGSNDLTIEGNTIQNSALEGITILNVDGITMRGNRIGTDENGTVLVVNGHDGCRIDGCTNAVIGGTTDATRNLFNGSQNANHGLRITNLCSNFAIFGNYFGVGLDGVTAMGNTSSGLDIETNKDAQGAHQTALGCSNIRIGGTSADSANVASNNGDVGIRIAAGTNIDIIGNKVGVGADGVTDAGNGWQPVPGVGFPPGIWINLSTDVQIGGANPGEMNVISGGFGNGVEIWNLNDDIRVQGNHIGVDITGTVAVPNDRNGVWVGGDCTNIQIGGDQPNEGNIISGNVEHGVFFVYLVHNSFIQGNAIGTGINGTENFGNGGDGISVEEGSTGNLIGGTTYGARNVIVNSGRDGIRVFNGNTNTQIKGNFVGLLADGTTIAPNGENGIQINNSLNPVIGGPTAAERNIVSGNDEEGIWVSYESDGAVIENNYVGLDSAGLGGAAYGNGRQGIKIAGDNPDDQGLDFSISNATIIDNWLAGSGRDIENTGNAIELGPDLDGALIAGNTIGFQVDGTAAQNFEHGIYAQYSSNVVIGGDEPATRNVIGNSQNHGINLNHSDGSVITGNYLGVWSDGATEAGNSQSGILVYFSNNTTIGGTSTGEENVISTNKELGIDQVGSTGSIIQGNLIGVSANWPSDTIELGNYQGGILFEGNTDTDNTFGAVDNVIGGSNDGEQNVIAYSKGILHPDRIYDNGNGYGIGLRGTTGLTNLNLISENQIFCNEGLGINLNFNNDFSGQDVGNDGYASPEIDGYSTAIQTSGIAQAGDTVEVFANPSGCGCEGEQFLGRVLADNNGDWSLDHIAVADSSTITAVAINSNQNTSEFSSCCRAEPGTLSIGSGTTACESDQTVKLSNAVGQTITWELFNGTDYDVVATINNLTNLEDQTYDYGLGIGDHQVRVTVSTVSAEGESCSQTTELAFTITAAPTMTVAAPGNACPSEAVTLSATDDGVVTSAMWSVVLGNGTIDNADQFNATYNMADVETDSVVIAILGTGGCEQAHDTVVIGRTPAPEGDFSVTTNDVCIGEAAQVTFTSIDGTSPFTLTYTENGNPQTINNVSSGDVLDFPLVDNTSITFTQIAAADDCTADVSNTVDLNVIPPLVVSSEAYDCPAATDYIVTFEVTGGDPGSYLVTGATGAFNGATWTSDPIPNGPYSITVTDGNNCAPVVISGDNSCDCVTAVNDLSSASASVCEDELVDWTFDLNSDWVNDGNDVIIFVLHEGNGPAVVNPIDTILLGNQISFNSARMNLGSTYYLSPVVGNDDGGVPDTSDICYQIGAGMAITFNANPAITTLSDTGACQGLTVNLNAGSWSAYQWSNGASTQSISVIADADQSIGLTVTDANGCKNDASANVSVFELNPISDIDQAICPDEPARVALSGYATYLWNDGSTASSKEFDIAGSYAVTVANEQGCQDVANVSISQQPTANIGFAAASTSICPGEDLEFDIDIVFSGTGDFDLQLTNDQVNFESFPGLTNGSNTITIDANHPLYPASSSLFTMVISDGAGCDQTPDPTADQVEIEVKSSPSLSAEDLLVCGAITNELDDDLVFTLLGSSDYDIYWTVNNTSYSTLNVPGPAFTIADAEVGTYSIDSIIGSNGCPEFPPSVTEVEVIHDDFEPADFDYLARPSCEGFGVEITRVSDAEIYHWDFGNGMTSDQDIPDVVHFENIEDISITFSASSINGCSDTILLGSDGVVISTGDNTIPNVFTPGDNDGFNDVLTLDPNEFYDGCIEFTVYDRWGIQIFDNSEDLTVDAWDGSGKFGAAPEGTYYYVFSVAESEKATRYVTLFR